MSQYQIGTVDVIHDSNAVTGLGTSWLSNVSIGDLFMISGINTHYEVATIPSDTSLTLNSAWAGSTLSGQNYEITRDFTSNYSLIEICTGDKDWPFHMTKNFRDIDGYLDDIQTAVDAITASAVKYTVNDHTDSSVVTLTSSDFLKVHICSTLTVKCIVYLPSIDSGDIGEWFIIVKAGAGEVEIQGADSDTIMDTGTQINNGYTTETNAFIRLYVQNATHWGCLGLLGRWQTS